MQILVPIKRVVDYNIKVRVKPDHSDVDLSSVKMSINPFCEIAVEEAVRLKEAGVATEIIVVSVGPKLAEQQLRAAMALGADRAILVETDEELQPLAIAKTLKGIVDRESPELVLFGKQSIDGENNQTGQMLAALANFSQATFASEVKLEGGQAIVTSEVDGGLKTIALHLPAVITADLRLNEPRYASMPNIMKAKKKPLEKMTPADIGVEITQTQETLKVEPPQERQGGIKVASITELVEKLKNEARVLS